MKYNLSERVEWKKNWPTKFKNNTTKQGYEFDTTFNKWRVSLNENLIFTNCPECKRRAGVEAKMQITSYVLGEAVVTEVYPIRCRSLKCKQVFFQEEFPPMFDSELVPKKEMANA